MMLASVLLLATWLSTVASGALAAAEPPSPGDVLPRFQLAVPQDREASNYLGLRGNERFTVSDIDAQVVIIEIFNMY